MSDWYAQGVLNCLGRYGLQKLAFEPMGWLRQTFGGNRSGYESGGKFYSGVGRNVGVQRTIDAGAPAQPKPAPAVAPAAPSRAGFNGSGTSGNIMNTGRRLSSIGLGFQR